MSICCNPITGNIKKVCGAKKGGLIRDLYVANFCDLSGVTFYDDSTGTTFEVGEITQINMKTDVLTSQPFHWYQLGVKKNTSGFSNTAEIGDSNKFWKQSVSFSLEGFDSTVKNAVERMIDGDAVFIGRTSDGKSHMLGRVSGAMMSEGSLGSGVAISDLCGGVFTFTSDELEITPSIGSGVTISVLNEDGITIDTVTL